MKSLRCPGLPVSTAIMWMSAKKARHVGIKPGQHALGGPGRRGGYAKLPSIPRAVVDRDAGMWCVVEHLVDSVGVEGCRVADPYPAGGRAGTTAIRGCGHPSARPNARAVWSRWF